MEKGEKNLIRTTKSKIKMLILILMQMKSNEGRIKNTKTNNLKYLQKLTRKVHSVQ